MPIRNTGKNSPRASLVFPSLFVLRSMYHRIVYSALPVTPSMGKPTNVPGLDRSSTSNGEVIAGIVGGMGWHLSKF